MKVWVCALVHDILLVYEVRLRCGLELWSDKVPRLLIMLLYCTALQTALHFTLLQ